MNKSLQRALSSKCYLLFILSIVLFSCENKSFEKPNVLFIAVDDLNDWVNVMGGHKGTLTPNIDKLANQGVLFKNAYCAAPACNPSRAALMTGIRPSTSGIYFNNQPWRKSEKLKNIETIPQYFRRHGYKVMGSGKIYHGRFPDPQSWDYYWPSLTETKPPDPMPKGRPLNTIPNTSHFDWGIVPVEDEEMGDYKVASWVVDQLNQDHEKPFFLAFGIFRPHLPWYAPEQYFDKYPLSEVQLPDTLEGDLNDIPEGGKKFIRYKDHENVNKYKQWERAVQGYQASITFADMCVGRVLEALDNSKYKENTCVVLWSDHGWSLGEKHHWRKFALWETTAKSVLIFAGPGIAGDQGNVNAPVNLIDIYPTLIDLCDLPRKSDLEGETLTPWLENPMTVKSTASITTHGKENHSVRVGDWHYIRYVDGGEELYNVNDDQDEFHNLAVDPDNSDKIKELKEFLPSINADLVEID